MGTGIRLTLVALAAVLALAAACQQSAVQQSASQKRAVQQSTAQKPSTPAPQQATTPAPAYVSNKAVGILVTNSAALQDSDPTFEKVTRYYGLTVRQLDVSKGTIEAADLRDEAGLPFRAIAINYNTLEHLGQAGNGGVRLLRDAVTSGANLLVSGISQSPGGSDGASLMLLTDNTVSGAKRLSGANRNWKVDSSFPDVTLELTGESVTYASQPQEDFGMLVQSGATGLVSLITSTDDAGVTYPVFARYTLGRGGIFLDSNTSGNLQKSRMIDLYNSRYFGRLVPVMMFTRYAFGDMAWHSNHRFANLTLDDPSLADPWYSFSYQRMLPLLKSNNFHLTVSMPPVSYAEAQKEVADLFLKNPDKLSVTVHGNNHDGYEFYKYSTTAGDQYPARPLPVQEANLVEALTRMEEFKRATGVPYSRVMVFPYNISPLSTITLMKRYNFAATANAGNVPLGEDAGTNYDFNMYPAIMDYSSFPLLTRYETNNLPTSMLFFAGKPLLSFAHIDFFRDKPEAFNALAQAINKSWGKTSVEWNSLDYIVKRLYLEKGNEDGSRGIMFFSNQLVVSNDSDQARTYRLQKVEGLEVPVEKVEVNGQQSPYSVGGGLLTLNIEIQPRSTAEVAIAYGDTALQDLLLVPNGMSYDRVKGMLNIQVQNRGRAPVPIPVAIYDGQNRAPVKLTTLVPLAPNQRATAGIDLSTLAVTGDFTVRLDPFGLVQKSQSSAGEGRLAAPAAAQMVLDDFEYNEAPSSRGWTVQKGSEAGSLRIVYDPNAASRVLELSSTSSSTQDFKVNYPAPGKSLGISKTLLKARVQSTRDFEIFVKVTGSDNNPYYLQYVSKASSPSSYKNYLIYPLGASFKDGSWHVLERDLNADMLGLLSRVDYFVVTGSVRLDNLTLASQASPAAASGRSAP